MIINDLDVPCVPVEPDETDPPAIVDADTVPALAVAPKGLEAIAGRNRHVLQYDGTVQHNEFPVRREVQLRRQALEGLPLKQRLGLFVGKRSDHAMHHTKRRRYCQWAILSLSDIMLVSFHGLSLRGQERMADQQHARPANRGAAVCGSTCGYGGGPKLRSLRADAQPQAEEPVGMGKEGRYHGRHEHGGDVDGDV